MIALILAAGLSAPAENPAFFRIDPLPAPAACPEGRRILAAKAQAPVGFHRLGDLPPANLLLPVMRSVQGCAVPTVIRYRVQQDGHFANGGS